MLRECESWNLLSSCLFPSVTPACSFSTLSKLDDNWYWWDNMTATGETHLIFIKNAEHSLATGIVEVVEAVSAFMHHVIAGKPRPTMTWEYGRNGTNGTISLVTSEKPKRVIIRHADTLQEERRDWRLITGANPCPWIAVKGKWRGE